MTDQEKTRADEATSSSLPHTEIYESKSESATTQQETTVPTETARRVQDSSAPNFMSEASSEPQSSADPGTEGTANVSDAAQTASAQTATRNDSIAIGPDTDASHTPVPDTSNPVCIITLLLTSGARHPYKLDEKYLIKRNVNVPGLLENGRKDPFSISVYTLKELILREWREEWEAQPSSPSSIRLIHFGRLLDDKTPLKDCRFSTESPNVVHMTVKPQDMIDDEEASKGKASGRERDGQEVTPGCRCVIL